MTNQELQALVEKISHDSFRQPFRHNARFNRRLKTTGGRYHLKSHDLDFNPILFEKYGEVELIKVIKHELCHYHLHLAGRGYQHKDLEFKQLLKKTGGSRFAPKLVAVTFKYISVENAIKKLSAVEKLIQNDTFVEVVMDS